MKRWIAVLPLLAATSLFGIEADDCSAANQLAALYALRGVMLRNSSSYDVDRFIDDKVNQLREPMAGGGFRWVRWVRPSGNPPFDKKGHEVAAVHGSGTDHFEASGNHVFGVRIAVPAKRSLLHGNNAVYVGSIHVRYTFNDRERTKDETIDGWMNPDTTRTIDLGTIADHAEVSLDASTDLRDIREALVEIHTLNAVPQDDPANPNYDTITLLHRLRNSNDPDSIDDEIARLEPGDSLPLAHIVRSLRRADELMHSKKQDDQEKGERLLREALRQLH